jgi:glutamyl-tRNA reductase
MAAPGQATPSPVVIAAHQRVTSLAIRDRLFIEDAQLPAFLAQLQAAGVVQAAALSTCDRVEVVAIAADPQATAEVVIAVLAGHAGIAASALAGELEILAGSAAVRHLFRVTASLDSSVVGDPHVLAQVKAAFEAAQAAGLCRGALQALLQAALATAKQVRSATGIGEGAVSVAAAVVDLARGVHGDLRRCRGMLLGASELGELVGGSLRQAGLQQLTVCHPRPERAEAVARDLDCHSAAFSALSDLLVATDLVIGCIGRRQHVLSAAMVHSALRQRRRRPILLVDVAVPGDFDAAIDRLDGAFLYTLDDLERVARGGLQRRAQRAAEAAALVDAAVAAFMAERARRAAVPAVRLLRHHLEALRAEALADAGGDGERATRLLVNRLLHAPVRALKQRAAAGGAGAAETDQMLALLRQLFNIKDKDLEDQ